MARGLGRRSMNCAQEATPATLLNAKKQPEFFRLEEVAGYGGLSRRERVFAEAIFAGCNQTQAARRAGVLGGKSNVRAAGAKLAAKPSVRAVIYQAWAKSGANIDDTVRQASAIAGRAFTDWMEPNLYAYVSNAPGTYMDPFGLCGTTAPNHIPGGGGGGGGGPNKPANTATSGQTNGNGPVVLTPFVSSAKYTRPTSCMGCHGLDWRTRAGIGLPMDQRWFNRTVAEAATKIFLGTVAVGGTIGVGMATAPDTTSFLLKALLDIWTSNDSRFKQRLSIRLPKIRVHLGVCRPGRAHHHHHHHHLRPRLRRIHILCRCPNNERQAANYRDHLSAARLRIVHRQVCVSESHESSEQ